jgi:hypothetical protein
MLHSHSLQIFYQFLHTLKLIEYDVELVELHSRDMINQFSEHILRALRGCISLIFRLAVVIKGC